MKKFSIVLVSLFTYFNLYSSVHHHDDHYEVRYVKENLQLDPQYQQFLRNGDLWQDFSTNFINWFVIFNESNQLPRRAFGAPINTNDIFTFLNSHNFILPSDLREKSITKNDKHINKKYVQFYNNLEVINSSLYAKFTLDNKLIGFGLDVFSDIDLNVNPSIDENSAISSAINEIDNAITDLTVENNLKVLAIPKYRKYNYHLVYLVKFSTRIEEGPANYNCYVDAHTGELLMRKNTVMYEAPPVTGTAVVQGDLYTTHPYNPATNQKFKYLKAKDLNTGLDYFTDINGEVTIPSTIGSSIEYSLEGQYAHVYKNGNTASITQNLASLNIIDFDNSNSTIQERSAYWAVNEIHDHLKSIFPTFTALDIPMETNVDEFGTCNAFYDGLSINFYQAGLSQNGTDYCEATGNIADVVYHEYGHAINSDRYNGTGWGGGMQNGALNEGYADIWAISLTQSPVLGIGFYQNNPNGFVRRYDQNRKVYPQDLVGEVHADGEIIAGAFWDTYLNLNSMSDMLDLFKYTYDSNVDGPDGTEGVIYTNILLEVLYADDNDFDLSNGTPNDVSIVSAFALHGITLLSNAVINHNPISSINGNTDIIINANVGMTYPWALGTVNCYYKLNNATSWNTVPMTGTTSFTTIIPAQPNGTIVSYYISLEDTYGNETGVTPIAANLSPLKNANLPYFIMIGYDLVQEEDFDFNVGFWQTGDVDDLATTGLWTIGVPIPSYGDPNDPNSICQTDAQHTTGGIECAFTGNASSASDGLGTNDVDGGHTTLFSPIYNLSNYANPAFSYYRWYTNSPYSGANPGADWWQVMITDDGLNWNYVENNKSSDISWRQFAFRISDYVNLTNSVQLKFIASDSIRPGQNLDGGSLVEAAVDDLMLYEAQPSITSLVDFNIKKPTLIKITTILGQIVDEEILDSRIPLLYIYDDGTVQKRFSIED